MPEEKRKEKPSNGKGRPASEIAGQQPLHAAVYGWMALIAMLIAVGLFVFYIVEIPKLEPESQSRAFYVVLLAFGVACAFALFGAMRGFARMTVHHLGVAIELGGPAALFALIVWGGFKIVPAGPDTFNLTVRAHASNGVRVTSGQVTLELGQESKTAAFDSSGDADFKGISTRFMGAYVAVWPHVDGFQQRAIQQKIVGTTLELALAPPDVINYQGYVQDEKGNLVEGVKVVSPDCSHEAITDAHGVFLFKIQFGAGRVCHFIFQKSGYAAYNTDVTIDESLSHPFLLRKKR
jgi:hypothetical protein